MEKKQPEPTDSPDVAAGKSKSMDERIPPVLDPDEAGMGPGEKVLAEEAKAARQQPGR